MSECDAGYYGDACNKSCSQHCYGQSSLCGHINGTCSFGCDAGYEGGLCEKGKISLNLMPFV